MYGVIGKDRVEHMQRALLVKALQVILVSLVGTVYARAEVPRKSYYEVPFVFYSTAIVLSVQTNIGALHLQLDTGSPDVVIDPEAFTSRVPYAVQGRRAGEFGRFEYLTVGNLNLGKLPYKVIGPPIKKWNELNPARKIDGLLGISALRNMTVGVDMLAHRLLFWNPGSYDAAAERQF